ncbi:Hypothetical protein FKW44_003168 [Caligus rogercresseyi]|uniref:Uncharacterized protein n=1 Tax=Caligus rogercresseyi TaxID=217165 RepID=A0A7T8QWR5_CALRO|nr:Hypothetical protein FKW44_003168 [Caligus rogercresseyi]
MAGSRIRESNPGGPGNPTTGGATITMYRADIDSADDHREDTDDSDISDTHHHITSW